MLTGQNGILNRAQEAKEKTEVAKQDESDKLSSMEAMVQTAGTKVTNPSSYGENPNAQATADGAGNFFALPNGAKYLEGTVDTGVVVEIKGSEFVWVPVDDVVLDTNRTSELPTSANNGTANGKTYTPMAVKVENTYKGLLYEFDENNSYIKYNDYVGSTSDYREPDIVSSYDGTDNDTFDGKITIEKLTTEYNSMINSVLKYKGFYIARYEAGIDNSTKEIVFKNASIEKNNVTTTNASTSETSSWYGLYKKIKTFSTSNDNIVSNMIWGSQYDAMMNWMIKNNESVGVSNSSKVNSDSNGVTGINPKDVINNVYDLYGCHREWTIETYLSDYRSRRGSDWSTLTLYPAFRGQDNPTSTDYAYSSRATLYIK